MALSGQNEPIAIIGMGCRFPGGANNPDAFWDVLNRGSDTSGEVPADRWEPVEGGESFFVSTRGHFLDARADRFDAGLFGLAPAELTAMDPQQRLLLEVAWEAFEDAGLPIDAVAGSQTAVFIGLEKSDYTRASLFSDDLSRITPHTGTGVAHSCAAGRLAYTFDLRGPAGVVDAACASSLLALDQACQKLWRGSADLALAGGVSLMLGPEVFAALSKLGALAPDGRCRTFDASGNGYGRGEGCGVLVLKRLSDAQRDGDRIQALVHGVAVGHGGRSNGLTAPNVRSQVQVIRAALTGARKQPADVDYVEAHGTGTQMGDPIEIAALAEVFGPDRPVDRPLLIGSAKSNIGHLEAAAGMAGIIKLVLAHQHGHIPPNCNFDTPNPFIDWDAAPIEVVSRPRPWNGPVPQVGTAVSRLAGVSAFGFSGTVAHALIGSPPEAAPVPKSACRRPAQILTLSARSTEALEAQARQMAHLLDAPGNDFQTVCSNANTTRKHHELRAAVIGDTPKEVTDLLKGPLEPVAGRILLGSANPNEAARTAFVFSGQGGLQGGVGADLYGTVPAFTDTIDRCAVTLDPVLGQSLAGLLFEGKAPETAFDDPRIAQPALFALQAALVAMWRAWGVTPSVLFGHSFGHFAAAHTAGVLSLDDALDLVIARGELAHSDSGEGRMAACFASAEQILETARGEGIDVAIAAFNAPENTTVSATPEAMETLIQALAALGITVKLLPIHRAFHSPLMQPVAEKFRARVAKAELRAATIPLILDMTGAPASAEEITDPAVWARQLLEPVQCMKALETLRGRECTAALEIGASSVLSGLGQENAGAGNTMAWLPSLRRSTSGWRQVLATLGELHVRGVKVDWRSFHSDDGARRIKLPTYPFQRKTYAMPLALPEQMREGASSDPRWAQVHSWLTTQGPSAQSIAAGLDATARIGRRRLVSFAQAIGLFDLARSQTSAQALLAALKISPGHERLMRWYLDILVDDGWLERKGDAFYVADRATQTDYSGWSAGTEAEEARLRQSHADLSAAFDLLARCFEALPDVLRGMRDPMEVLMPGGSTALLDGLYGDGHLSRSFNTVMALAVPAALTGLETPRVLEIGGGTGGVTRGIVDSLASDPRPVHYTFTDVSDGFVMPARERWTGGRPSMAFATFDVTVSPSEQGFEPGSQDVLVASNVLHATRNIVETLRNAAQLLRPGGRLIVNEVTRLHDVVGMIFGLTPGWWHYEDETARIAHSPVLSVPGWKSALAQAGFIIEEVFTLPGDDKKTPVQAAIVARLTGQSASGAIPAAPAVRTEVQAPVTASLAERSARADHLQDVSDLIRTISGIEIAGHDLDSNLFALGMDSLLLMQLRNAVQKRFGVDLKMSRFHEELSSVRRIADYLAEVVPPAPVAAPSPRPEPPVFQAHPVAETFVPAVPLPTAAAGTSLEAIVQQQLKLMSDQIALLSGQRVEASPPRPAAAVAPVPPVNTARNKSHPATMPAAGAPLAAAGSDLTDRQRAYVRDLIARYTERTAASKTYAGKARPKLADWIATIGYNPDLKELVYPIVSAGSEGSRIRDIDGNSYIDLSCGFGVDLLGHQPAFVTEAIRKQLSEGMELATQSDLAEETAELLCDLTGCERVAFSNTGTEAVMTAYRLARAVTGKSRIAIFRGSFHGSYDGAMAFGSPLGTMSASLGILQNQIEDVIVLDYGSEAALETIAAEADQLAGVLVEPVQSRNPELQPRDFLHALRKLTGERDITLIFDELITGFRCHPGGAQAYFGVKADIVTYGKVLGGGLPISAIAGKARFIDPMDGGAWTYGDDSGPTTTQIFFGGTFCRHPLAMASARATLNHLKMQGPALQRDLSARTRDMTGRLNAMFARLGIPFRIAFFASQFQLRQVTAQGEVYQTLELSLFFFSLVLQGVYTWERRTCFLSTAHSDTDIAAIEKAMEAAARDLLKGGFFGGGNDGSGKKKTAENEALPGSLVLTATQREMRLLALKHGDGERVETLVVDVAGRIDADRLRDALQTVVSRHDILQTRCVRDGLLVPGGEMPGVNTSVLSQLPADQRDTDGSRWVADLAASRMHASHGPLLACDLLDLDNGHTLVAMRAHPLICDGWSMGVVISELAALYEGKTGTSLLPAPSFADFVRWSEKPDPAALVSARDYWEKQLETGSEPVVLPSDRLALRGGSRTGQRLRHVIDTKAVQALEAFGEARNASLFAVLLTAYATLVARLSGAARPAIGIPVPGQAAMDAQGLVGQCAMTVPLILEVDGGEPGEVLLERIKREIMALLDHQSVRPQDALTDAAVLPALTVGFNLDRDPGLTAFGGHPVSVRPVPVGDPKYALSLNAIVQNDEILLDFDFDSGSHDPDTITAWAEEYTSILSDLCGKPAQAIGKLGRRQPEDAERIEDLAEAVAAALSNAPERVLAVDAHGREITAASLVGASGFSGAVTALAERLELPVPDSLPLSTRSIAAWRSACALEEGAVVTLPAGTPSPEALAAALLGAVRLRIGDIPEPVQAIVLPQRMVRNWIAGRETRSSVRLIVDCTGSPYDNYAQSIAATLAEGSSVRLVLRPLFSGLALGSHCFSSPVEGSLARFEPLAGVAVSVLDTAGLEAPVGCPGDLHVDGGATGLTAVLAANGGLTVVSDPLESAVARALLLSRPEVAHVEGPLEDLIVTLCNGSDVKLADLAAGLARVLRGPAMPRRISLRAEGRAEEHWNGRSPDHSSSRGEHLDTVVEVFRTLLGEPNVSARDSFFELGGTSLTALRIAAEVERRTGRHLEASVFFRELTPAGIAAHLAQDKGAASAAIPSTGLTRAPASPAQRRIWTLSQLEGQEAFYVLSGAFVFDGLLDSKALRTALDGLLQRHSILRTGYELNDGVLWQTVRASEPCELAEETVTGTGTPELLLADAVHRLGSAPYDLQAGQVFRASLVRLETGEDTRHVLVYAMHHIAFDGWSEEAFIADLTGFYEAALEARAAELPDLSVQHIDACLWQDARLHEPEGRAALERWAARLEDMPPQSELPRDRARARIQSFTAARHDIRLSSSTTSALQDLARQSGTTPYLATVAGLKALVHRYTGASDITFGSAITRRGHPDLLGQIGNFVNTLALRDRVRGADSFAALLGRVAETATEAFADGDTPIDAILSRLGRPRDVARAALFDILVSAADIARPELRLGGVKGKAVADLTPPASGFDLYFEIAADESETLLRVTYNSDLFDAERIVRMGRHLEILLSACTAQPTMPLALLPVASATEMEQVKAGAGSPEPHRFVLDDRLSLCPPGIEGAVFESCSRDTPEAIPAEVLPEGWIRDTGLRAQFKPGEGLVFAVEPAETEDQVSWPGGSGDVTDRLLGIWRAYLPTGVFPGPEDSFFALGGNSLGAVQIVAQLRDAFDVDLGVRDLFERPSVAEMQGLLGGAGEPQSVRLSPADQEGPALLSPAQERMWLLDRMAADRSAYCICGAFWVDRPLDEDRLRAALGAVAQRHEALRCAFEDTGSDTPQLKIADRIEPVLTSGAASSEADALARASELAGEGFDLAEAPLWRVHVEQAGARSLLVICLHHAIADGWSVAVLMRDLSRAYGGGALAAPTGTYSGHATQRRLLLDSPAGTESRAYWEKTLADAPRQIELFTDRPRPAVKSYRGGTVHSRLTPEMSKALRALAAKHRGTLYHVLMALSAALLHRYSGQGDLVIGSVAAGRRSKEEFDQVGCFIENFVLRLKLDPETTFAALLDQTRERLSEAQEHSHYPVEHLGQARGGTGRGGRLGLYNVIVTVEEFAGESLSFDGRPATAADLPGSVSRADLIFYLLPSSEGIDLELEYDTDIFDSGTVQRMADHLGELASAVAAAPESLLPALQFIGDEERDTVVRLFNDTGTAYPREASVVDLFRQVAGKMPEATALRHEAKSVSYGEIDRWSDRIAAGLVAGHGVAPGDLVGLIAHRRPALVAAMLGVLKAGATYVPIDPDYPADRIATLLDIARPKLTLSDTEAAQAKFAVTLKAVEADPEGVALPESGAETPAYVMFTSGSTGTPKGVVVPHRAIVRLVRDSDVVPLGPDDRLLLTGALSFDATTYEIWGPLLNGGCLVLADREALLDPWAVADIAAREGVTVMWLTATLFNTFADLNPGVFASLTTVLTGGERISASHVAAAMTANPLLTVVNGYGPTENTTFSATYRIETPPEPGADMPIGRPIANSTLFILDSTGAPVPIGMPGEIWVGGDGLAIGYLGREDLTEERFVRHSEFGRLYRTGDLGLWRADGTVRYLGRSDDQLKIRGHRIEPGEIAAVLEAQDGVRQAAVIARPGPAGPELAAYIVVEGAVDLKVLRSKLAQQLPAPLVPAHLISLDSLPIDGNGKLDRRALPEPASEPATAADAAARPVRGPANRIETEISEDWAALLGAPVRDMDADFYMLGGHSLLAVRLINRIQTRYGPVVSLRDLFEKPTVAGLAARVIDGLAGGAPRVTSPLSALPASESYPASAQQQRLCFLQQLDGPRPDYTVMGGYWIDGPLDEAALQSALETVTRRHEALRTRFVTRRGEVRQRIEAEGHLALERRDFTEEDDPAPAAVQAAQVLAAEGWNLQRGPLARACLFRTGTQRSLFLLSLHHAICDGWSMDVLTREITAAYSAACGGPPADLPVLPCQPKEIAAWQSDRREGPDGRADLAYWTARLDGVPARFDLHPGRAGDLDPDAIFAHRSVVALDGLTEKLQTLGSRHSASLFSTLTAFTAAVLHRLSGQRDLWIGTPVAGRNLPEFEGQVGYLSDMVVLRAAVDTQMTVASLVERTGHLVREALSHQDVPVDEIVRELGLNRDQPLFDTIVALEDIPAVPDLPGLSLSTFDAGPVGPKTGLSFTYLRGPDGALSLQLDAHPARFTAERTGQIAAAVGHLIRSAAAAQADTRLGVLPLQDTVERTRLVRDFACASAPAVETEATVLERFAEQVAGRGDAAAVCGSDGTLSYRDLDQTSNAIAHSLRDRFGIEAGSRVGLALPRDSRLIAAMLSILKAGAAYVPVDPAAPAERVAGILADAGCAALICDRSAPADCWGFTERMLAAEDLSDRSEAAPDVEVRPDDLAYVIFTSGSTGRPKGVMIEHGSVTGLVEALQQEVYAGLEGPQSVALVAPPIFDASVQQIFAALCGGHRLVVVDGETRRDGRDLIDLFAREGVSVSDATPSLLSLLLNLGFAQSEDLALRHILVGGEALPAKLAQAVLSAPSCTRLKLTNVYGPTECTVDCSAHRLTPADLKETGLVSIGRPLGRARLLVLDPAGEPAPVGSPGEIHVGGPGLARGYLDPSLTEERFIRHAEFGRLYRTGDLGVWDADGSLHFLGRRDDQIKLRGYRIELAEVDAGLNRIPGVRRGAGILRGQGETAQIIGFVECARETGSDLRAAAAGILPDYMVPSEIVCLDTLPSTPGGKIDRRALAALYVPAQRTGPPARRPGNTRERSVLEIWSHVLDRPTDDMTADFFACGGHSLAAARLIGLVEETFGVTVSLRAFFDQPTPEGLCALIDVAPDAETISADPAVEGGTFDLSPAQYRLWAIDQMHEESPGYAMPAAWRICGRFDPEVFRRAIDKVAMRHEALRTRFEMQEGQPVQVIDAAALVDFSTEEIPSGDDPMAEALARCAQEVARPFDLENGPLLRVRLWTVAENEHVLFVNLHHIIADGHSLDLLAAELWPVYAAMVEGRVPDPARPAPQYRAHVARMQARARGPKAQSDLRYWQEVLTPLTDPLDLPTDRVRPPVRNQSGASLDLTAGESVRESLAAVARMHGTTPFSILTALSAFALHALSGQNDLILGIPVEGRPDRDSRTVIGLCAETIPLRVTLEPGATFAALVKQVRSGLANTLDRLDCPFDRIVDAVKPPSRPDRSMLFDAMVSYRLSEGMAVPGELEVTPLPLPVQGSQLDLALLFAETPGSLTLSLQYDDALFDAARVEGIGQYVLSLLETCAGLTDLPLQSLPRPDPRLLSRAAESPPQEVETSTGGPAGGSDRMLDLWREVLSLPTLGPDDDFFAAGGHSLTAAWLVQRVYADFGAKLRLNDVMRNPTAAALAGYVGKQAPESADRVKRLPKAADYALSPAQRRFWVLEQLEGQQGYGLLPGMAGLDGPLDESAFAMAVRALCKRHESLRTVITTDPQGEPRQKILGSGSPLATIDLSGSKSPETDAEIWFAPLLSRPFDLEQEPLFRIGLARTGPESYLLGFCLHHLIADGWSMGVLVRDLSALYAAAKRIGPKPASLQRQFRDCAAHQAERADAPEELDYWRGKLAGPPARLDLPTDRPRPKRQDIRGAMASFKLDTVRTARLQSLAAERNLTLFAVLAAVFQTLLHRYSGQDDLTLGTPVAGREHPDYGDQVGLFLNQLALRVTLDPDAGFDTLLQATGATISEALDRQNIPFDRIVEALDLPRDVSRSVLFDAMIVMQDPDHAQLSLGDVSVVRRMQAAAVAKTDLTLIIEPEDDEITAYFEYATALFDHDTIERMIGTFGQVVDAVTADPSVPLGALEIVCEEERQALLDRGGLSLNLKSANGTILNAVGEFVKRTPQAPATTDRVRTLSYETLAGLSDHLAGQLVQLGIEPGTRVGIELPRDARLPVALLGVLKAGAAFVPLDPALPEERRKVLIEEAGCALVLTDFSQGKLRQNLTALLDAPRSDVILPKIGARMLAYVLFTSGSTGKPKGVMIEHGALAAFCQSLPGAFGLGSEDRVAALTNISFDISILELLGTLTFGACVLAITAEDAQEPECALEALAERKATVLQATPTRLALLLDMDTFCGTQVFAPRSALRTVLTGGEALPAPLRERLAALDHLSVYEVYGPTETTIWSCARRITETSQADLGRPLPGEGVAVLSPGGALQPIGAPGEIAIFGAGLARGYLDDRQRTAQAFPERLHPVAGRLYRTGDQARWRADGRLEFLGRTDGQIKLRGNRIEIGEVEAALSAQPGIRHAAVELRGAGAEAMLVAHVAGDAVDPQSLLSALRAKLPAAAVPGQIVPHEQLPLLPSGKIDRRALSLTGLSEFAETGAPSAEVSFNQIEAEIAAVFATLLKTRMVDADASFFDMGGQSLLAARAVRQLRDRLGCKVDLGDLFAMPSVRALGEALRQRGQADRPPLVASRNMDACLLTHAQRRIWTAQQLSKESAAYVIHAALRFNGTVRIRALKKAFSAVVARHGALRTAFLTGIEGPRQVIHDDVPFTLVRSRADDEKMLAKLLAEDASEPFDLAQAPLFRARLIDVKKSRSVLSVSLHHAVADGRSLELLMSDLETAYSAAIDGRDCTLPAQDIQFTDYARWERQVLEAPSIEADRDYWRKTLSTLPAPLDLPFASTRPSRQTTRGETFRKDFDAEQAKALRELAARQSATVFAVFLAAVSALLQRLTGREDMVLGTVSENREHVALDAMIGCFVNVLPLRMRPTADLPVSALIVQAREVITGSLRHGHVPFEQIVQETQAAGTSGRSPLFDIAVTWNELDHTARADFAGVPITDVSPASPFAKYDLLFVFSPAESGGIACAIEYRSDLYSQTDIEYLAGLLDRVLEEMAAAPENPIMDLGIGIEESTFARTEAADIVSILDI
ncbi:amino acid adenylation domain-containing protein [Roseibium marinum]|uniref:Amino acid adenylation domain-containing protein n=2 Tax=Roseibium marinum TaxID=281252 RepID=A0A2S3UT31_9HYPH|nr:amino acid adenylation domain-containing protein [Roseibium marinum]